MPYPYRSVFCATFREGRYAPDERCGYASRGVMRKTETTSAWCASGWAT